MRFQRLLLYLLMLAWHVTAISQDVADDVNTAEINSLINKCEHCHGPGGASPKPGIPILSGRPASEIRDILLQFRHYERFCRQHAEYAPDGEAAVDLTMCDVVSGLTPEDMITVSEYFSQTD